MIAARRGGPVTAAAAQRWQAGDLGRRPSARPLKPRAGGKQGDDRFSALPQQERAVVNLQLCRPQEGCAFGARPVPAVRTVQSVQLHGATLKLGGKYRARAVDRDPPHGASQRDGSAEHIQ